MATANRMRRAARWLAGAGVLALPACSTLDTAGPSVENPTLPRRVARTPAPRPLVIPAGGQLPTDGGEKVAPAATPAHGLPPVPVAATQGKPLPIDLPTALALTNANPLDIQIADERLRAGTAALDRAKVMWLPNIGVGADYYRHDGQIQDIAGAAFTTSRSSLLLGAGPTAVFPVSEALYAPLAARQVLRARQADVQAARNDTTLTVAEAGSDPIGGTNCSAG